MKAKKKKAEYADTSLASLISGQAGIVMLGSNAIFSTKEGTFLFLSAVKLEL